MRPFEYARPETESEAVEFLSSDAGVTAVLAGGTDLLNLMKADVLRPSRVVDIKRVTGWNQIVAERGGVSIGSAVTLAELASSPLLADYRSVLDVVDGIRAIQLQSAGTLVGDLCHQPNCWYFRNGYGLLGWHQGESLPELGDHRYHAILGNHGPAKYVSASRFAPAGMAWGAQVRVIGPQAESVEWLPLEYLYRTATTNQQSCLVLQPGQVISHVWLPDPGLQVSATYEVLQLQGLDWPLASAAATLHIEGGIVRQARIVMGQVAPVPWVAEAASRLLIGRAVNDTSASEAGDVAVSGATPLPHNEYKVQLARTAVKRAVLKAAGLWEGA
jgi:xanthine dehydrogenase YagS FAD-binding subunit